MPPTSIRRDIAIIQRELPLDLLEFFILTPLPGSEDHQALWRKRVPMDPDLNRYDLEHVVTDHPRMIRDELQAVYEEAWPLYYTRKHMETLQRRAVATGVPVMSLIKVLVPFSLMVRLERVHPLQSGLLRQRHRSERRPGLPREGWLAFQLKHYGHLFAANLKLIRSIAWILGVKCRIDRDPNRHRYTDLALTPVGDDDQQTFDFMTQTAGAKAAVQHQRRVAGLVP